jgi:hypothetical protein
MQLLFYAYYVLVLHIWHNTPWHLSKALCVDVAIAVSGPACAVDTLYTLYVVIICSVHDGPHSIYIRSYASIKEEAPLNVQ